MPIIAVHSRQLDCVGEVISVGRDPGCAISFPEDTRLANVHAHIRSVAGRWLVEATEGRTIRVGYGQAVTLAWLNPGDVIHLTNTGPELVFRPETSATPAVAQSPSPVGDGRPPAVSPATVAAAEPRTRSQPSTLAATQPNRNLVASLRKLAVAPRPLWIGGISCLGLLVVLALMKPVTPRPDGSDKTDRRDPEGHDQPTKVETPIDPLSGQADTPPASIPETLPPWPRSAIYVVRLRAPDQPQTFQLGTAWAISKRRLVTSAAIVTGVRDLQNKLPLVTVFQPGLKLDAQVVSSRVHPQYEPAWRDANAARSEVEQLERELVDPADPNRLADANRLNEIKTQRIAVEERLYQAASRLVAHDVAVLEVSRDLPASLALSDRVTTISPASRVTLATFPLRFQSQDHLVDPEQPPQLVEATGRLMNRVPLDSHPTAGWWRLNVSTDLAEQNCSGSPVLNSRNQVVGLYSRPTPPDRIQPTPSAIHDITEIDRLRDFLPAP